MAKWNKTSYYRNIVGIWNIGNIGTLPILLLFLPMPPCLFWQKVTTKEFFKVFYK